jgi:cytochrome c5
MRAGLFILLALSAAGPARAASGEKRLFEEKCLYCHSAAVIEHSRMRAPEWRRLVARMRAHAPLLISPKDASVVVHYLVHELQLVPDPTQAPKPRRAREPRVAERTRASEPGPVEAPRPPEPVVTPPAPAEAEATEPQSSSDPEAEAVGPKLIAEKCSKCHTVRRVFMKIDSASLGDSVIERMRRKTGSGISPDEAELLHRFVRARTSEPE